MRPGTDRHATFHSSPGHRECVLAAAQSDSEAEAAAKAEIAAKRAKMLADLDVAGGCME